MFKVLKPGRRLGDVRIKISKFIKPHLLEITDKHQMKLRLLILSLFLPALLAAWLTIGLAPPPACDIGANSDLACARGFETRERAGDTTFRWSDGYAEVHLAGLGYGAPAAVTLTLRSGRPAGSAPIPARLGLNGQALLEMNVPPETRRYRLLLPPDPRAGDLARLQLAAATWRPDVRNLGLVVLDVETYVPPGIRWPGPRLLLAWVGLFLAAHLATGGRPRWGGLLPLLLLPLAAFTPLVAYLPGLSLLAGSVVLAWRLGMRQVPTRQPACTLIGKPQLLLILIALFYLLLITGVAPDWATLPLLVACAGLAWAGAVGAKHVSPLPPAATLLVGAAVLRLLLLAGRLLSGQTALDSDIELFYAYGMALREIGLPEVEYPSGALLPWAFLSWLSGDSREAFALLLPLFSIGCDVLIVAALLRLSRVGSPTAVAIMPAVFYAFSPLLEPFVFAKYDALPAALAIGGRALFAARWPGWAGLALGIGATVKWTPVLAVPFLGLYLLRRRSWRDLGWFSGGHLIGLALPSLPFALTRPENFLLPYTLQGGRGAIAESVWLLVALPFDPGLPGRIGAPWGEFESTALSIPLMVGVQLAVLGLLGLIALLRPPDLRRTLALAALAPVMFLLLNRVFSPQYLLPISAGLLAALTLVAPGPGMLRAVLALLALAQVANFLIWPAFSSYWIIAGAVLFAALLLLSAWLIQRTARPHSVPARAPVSARMNMLQ